MENNRDKILAFDTLFTTNHIQMMKILLSYLDPSRQKTMAVYIKFMELQYTISFFQNRPPSTLSCFPQEGSFNPSRLLGEILPLCTPSEQENFLQIKNMMETFENMQGMMETMQMMKDLFPEGGGASGMDPSAFFSGDNGMDLSQMFEMFQTMQDINM